MKAIITVSITVIAILLLLTTITAAKAYTIDATLGPTKLGILAQTTYELQNIKITDLPKNLQATDATLTTMFGGKPTISLYKTYVGFSGSLEYKTADGSTNLASTSFTPNIKKITEGSLAENTPWVYTLKDSFTGQKGKLTLNGPSLLATNGTLHIEGITDPTTD
jgi:hypothetical protein